MSIDRGVNGRLKRLPTLDMESHYDFMIGVRSWMFKDLSKATAARANALMAQEKARGGNLSFGRSREMFEADQTVMLSQRVWVSTQLMQHHSLLDGFRRHKNEVRSRYAASEASDCGTMSLDPDLDIPEYARHEIHIQPGGYVGEEMAGPIYHYGTNSFYLGWNDQDEVYFARAKQLTLPKDGKLERILDIGSGIGQYVMALKETYPQAEVWGVEVGEPLIRYARARAVEQGTAVHLKQALAEDTGFEDASFDVVSAHILFHEVNNDAAAKIIKEAARLVRPGGVFDIVEFTYDREFDAYSEYRMWADHHYNNEPWEAQYFNRPFVQMLEAEGFEISYDVPALSQGSLKKYIARKPG